VEIKNGESLDSSLPRFQLYLSTDCTLLESLIPKHLRTYKQLVRNLFRG